MQLSLPFRFVCITSKYYSYEYALKLAYKDEKILIMCIFGERSLSDLRDLQVICRIWGFFSQSIYSYVHLSLFFHHYVPIPWCSGLYFAFVAWNNHYFLSSFLYFFLLFFLSFSNSFSPFISSFFISFGSSF